MNNIAVAKETMEITKSRRYEKNGTEITLPEDMFFEGVFCITPEEGAALVSAFSPRADGMCRIEVTAEDSFAAARRYENALVMNFANAHHPGGGFLLGANAQEEALCRCSTLYASLTSETASQMYRWNNTHVSRVESDYMLLSPEVCIFRDEHCALLDTPVCTAVITLPAPNRRGAAMLASKTLIAETFLRRIRIMLAVAADHGYKNLVLGAWGCGAFGNNADDVAGFFRQVLIGEQYGTAFDTVCFAVYGKEDGRNITAFRRVFEG